MPRPSILRGDNLKSDSATLFKEPYAVKATNDKWNPLLWIFDDSATRDGLHGTFEVPPDYASGADLIIIWTAIATSGDVEWDFDYRAVGGNDSESLDQATAQESVNANDTAPSAVNERMELSVALTDGNFAAGDTVEFILARDGTDGGDDMSAAAILIDARFDYTAS